MSHPGGGAHAAPEPSTPGSSSSIPRAEQIHGAHDNYDKGEIDSVGALIADISEDLSTLMQQEVALAKAELKQSASKAGVGAGMLGGAGVAGHFTLLFLSIALWWALGDLMGLGWSALVVALIWAVIAAVLAVIGRNRLKDVEGMPHTVETAKKVPDALKGNEDHR
ncbi:phage holin family protein [Ornithinimicrobium pratense]|uniref:Phage holin family protein n=1 Tax=Ornithinimicrobium pratense TaxID=2593973 RepID=A0A5J6V5T2_9MICO|nr:phage holin family protein [Ornithinimicrobium pratense]